MSQGKQVPLCEAWFIDRLFDRFATNVIGINPVEVRKALNTVEVDFTDELLRHWMTHPLSKRTGGMRRLPREAFHQIFCPERFTDQR